MRIAIDPKAGMTRKFMTRRAVIGSVLHVARFKELGTVEAGIGFLENLSEIQSDDRDRVIRAERSSRLRLFNNAEHVCDFDEVLFAHFIPKRPARVEITA